jgi:hypothetical protein
MMTSDLLRAAASSVAFSDQGFVVLTSDDARLQARFGDSKGHRNFSAKGHRNQARTVPPATMRGNGK